MPPPPKYLAWRSDVEAEFARMAPIPGSKETYRSPSGNHGLEITQYGTEAKTSRYTRGQVRRVTSGSIAADIVRNNGNFWFAWAKRDREEYLLCGEDYQGYNVVEWEAGRNQLTFPEEAFEGRGYGWTAVHVSPDARTLAVEGCFWECPYSLAFFDFSDQDLSPLPKLAAFQSLDTAHGWIGNDEFRLGATGKTSCPGAATARFASNADGRGHGS